MKTVLAHMQQVKPVYWAFAASIIIAFFFPRSAAYISLLILVVVSIETRSFHLKQSVKGFLLQVSPLIFFSLVTAGLSAASIFWSVDKELSEERSLKLLGIISGHLIVFYMLYLRLFQFNNPLEHGAASHPENTEPFKGTGLITAVISVLLVTFSMDYMLNTPVAEYLLKLSGKDDRIFESKALFLSELNSNMIVLFLLFLPCLIWLSVRKNFIWLGITAAALLACALHTNSESFIIGLIITSLTMAGYLILGRAVIFLSAAALMIFLLSFPWVIQFVFENRFGVLEHHEDQFSPIKRLIIWNSTAELALEKPLFGHGINTFRDQTIPFNFRGHDTKQYLHPHNGFAQIWYEFGIFGALLFSAAIGHFYYRISKTELRYTRLLYISVANAFASLVIVSYGLWQSWWIGMMFIVTFLTLIFGNALNQQKKLHNYVEDEEVTDIS